MDYVNIEYHQYQVPTTLDHRYRNGWNYPRVPHAYLTAYYVTGNSEWVKTAQMWTDLFVESTDKKLGIYDSLGNSEDVFSSISYSNDGSYFPNEPSFGLYAHAISETNLLLHEIGLPVNSESVELAVSLSNRAMRLMEVDVKATSLKVEWDRDYNPFRKKQYKYDNVPLNMQAHTASGLLTTWKYLEKINDARYIKIRDAWHKVAMSLSDSMMRGSRMRWKYYNDSRIDDWGHSGAFIHYMAIDRKYGGVFDESDEHRVWRILDHTRLNGEYLNPMRIDGSKFTEATYNRYFTRYLSTYQYWAKFLAMTGRDKDAVRLGLKKLADEYPASFYILLSEIFEA